MSSPIDNNEFLRIGRKHDNNKSHSAIAMQQSKKRDEILEKRIESFPKKMRAKLSTGAGHGRQISTKSVHKMEPSIKPPNRKTYFKDDDEMTNQYQEIVQGEEDAYEEIEANGREEFFEEHFRLLKELNEAEYHDYLNNVYAVNAHEDDMSGCEWIMVNENIEKYETRRNKFEEEVEKGRKGFDLSDEELNVCKRHLGNLESLKKYYEETDAVVNPEYLEELKADIKNFDGDISLLSYCASELKSEPECCSEEWMEMVDAVNREQGYY